MYRFIFFGVSFVCSFFSPPFPSFTRGSFENKGCWILDLILFFFYFPRSHRTPTQSTLNLSLRDKTSGNMLWRKLVAACLMCSFFTPVCSIHSFLFLCRQVRLREAGFLCCQPRDYIKEGSLSREMLLATLRGPFPNLITYFTYIENMRRTKVVPVHYKWAVQDDVIIEHLCYNKSLPH